METRLKASRLTLAFKYVLSSENYTHKSFEFEKLDESENCERTCIFSHGCWKSINYLSVVSRLNAFSEERFHTFISHWQRPNEWTAQIGTPQLNDLKSWTGTVILLIRLKLLNISSVSKRQWNAWRLIIHLFGNANFSASGSSGFETVYRFIIKAVLSDHFCENVFYKIGSREQFLAVFA